MRDDILWQIIPVVALIAGFIWVLPLMFPRKTETGYDVPRRSLVLVASHICSACLGVEVFLFVLMLANHLSWR